MGENILLVHGTIRSTIQSESARANETEIKGGRQVFVSIMSRLDFPENERIPEHGSATSLYRIVNEEIIL